MDTAVISSLLTGRKKGQREKSGAYINERSDKRICF